MFKSASEVLANELAFSPFELNSISPVDCCFIKYAAGREIRFILKILIRVGLPNVFCFSCSVCFAEDVYLASDQWIGSAFCKLSQRSDSLIPTEI